MQAKKIIDISNHLTPGNLAKNDPQKSIINKLLESGFDEDEIRQLGLNFVSTQYVSVNNYFFTTSEDSKYFQKSAERSKIPDELPDEEIILSLSEQIKSLNNEVIELTSEVRERLDKLDQLERR